MAGNKCTGNCMECSIVQRQYCSSQIAYSNMRMLEQMSQTMAEMSKKIEALQDNEALLFDPTSNDETAQSGVGAI